MKETLRLVGIIAVWLALACALVSACGCATVKKAAPYAARAGICCAKCVAEEWKSFKSAQAEAAPGGAP